MQPPQRPNGQYSPERGRDPIQSRPRQVQPGRAPRPNDPSRTHAQRTSWWRGYKRIRLWHVLAFMAIVLVFVIHYSAHSASMRALEGELADTREALREALVTVSEKERELQFTETDEYVEQQARERFGYIMPGERRFMPFEPAQPYAGTDTDTQAETEGTGE